MSHIESETDLLTRVAERVGQPEQKPAPSKVTPLHTPLTPLAEKAQRQLWTLPGIFGQTRVSTNFGEVPAHLIRENDYLRTRDHGFLQVQRIEEYHLDEEFLQHRPDAKPVLIRANALGRAHPSRDIYLSPGQKVLKMSSASRNNSVMARDLSQQKYMLDRSLLKLSYYVFHMGQPTLIRSEGVWINVELA